MTIVFLLEFRAHSEDATTRRHRIKSIDRQIYEDLLKLFGVAFDRQRSVTEFHHKSHAAPPRLGFHQLDHVFDDRRYVVLGSDRLSATGIIQEHLHDPRDTLYLVQDYLQSLSRLIVAGIALEQQLCAGSNDRHRSADFVRQTRRKRSDRSQAVGALKPAIEFEFIAVPLHQVLVGFGEALVEALEFLTEQLYFVVRKGFAGLLGARKA